MTGTSWSQDIIGSSCPEKGWTYQTPWRCSVVKYWSRIEQREFLNSSNVGTINPSTLRLCRKGWCREWCCQIWPCSFVNFSWGRKSLAWNISRRPKYSKWCDRIKHDFSNVSIHAKSFKVCIRIDILESKVNKAYVCNSSTSRFPMTEIPLSQRWLRTGTRTFLNTLGVRPSQRAQTGNDCHPQH